MCPRELQAHSNKEAPLTQPSGPEGFRDQVWDCWEYQAPKNGLPPRLYLFLSPKLCLFVIINAHPKTLSGSDNKKSRFYYYYYLIFLTLQKSSLCMGRFYRR